jgi:hypothetical protein
VFALILGALVEAGVPQAVARLLAEGLDYTVRELKRVQLGPTAAGTVSEIILGIARDFPDAPAAEKRERVRAAATEYLRDRGEDPTPKALDTLIQLAVNALLGGRAS